MQGGSPRGGGGGAGGYKTSFGCCTNSALSLVAGVYPVTTIGAVPPAPPPPEPPGLPPISLP